MEGVDLERLQEQLLDKDQDRRAIAIVELEQRWKEIGSAKAISLLKAALDDDTTSQDNRQLIIGGLARIGSETQAEAEVISILTEAMNQATESRLDALVALAKIGEKPQAQAEVIPTLIQAAESKDEELRYYAVNALGIMQHPDAMEFLADQVQTDIIQILDGPLAFGNRIVLSDGSSGTATPKMALSGRNVYVTWDAAGGAAAEVYFTRSNNSGASFESAINLSGTSAPSEYPAIAASGNNVYVVWRDEFAREGDIFFARSNNNGASFFQRVNLSNSPGLSSRDPQIAADGNFVYVVWVEDLEGRGQDILFRASADNGATFGEIVNLSETVEYSVVDGFPQPHYWPAASSKPAVATVGGNVYVVWVNPIGEFRRVREIEIEMVRSYHAIVCRTSADGGASFDAPIILSRSPSAWGRPLVAAKGDNVYVVWSDVLDIGGNEDILLAASRDRGARFDDAVNLSNTEARSLFPRPAASDDSVYVVWQEDVGGNEDVLFRASSNRGVSFGALVNLSDNDEDSVSPSISASGNYVYVAWMQMGGQQSDILLRSSTKSGGAFGVAINISDVPDHGSSNGPSVIGDGSNVYTVWQDHAYGAIFRKGSRR